MTLTNGTDTPTTNYFPLDIDSPTQNSQITGLIEVRGWTFSSSALVRRVAVFLEEVYLGTVKYGIKRDDVALLHVHPGARKSGFFGRLVIPATVTPGTHQLTIRVTDANHQTQEKTCPVEVLKPVITGQLDEPAADTDIINVINIRGWAFSTVATIERVEVFLGEQLLGKIRHGISRADVAELNLQTEALTSGFAGQVQVTGASPGDNEISVRVTDANQNVQEYRRWLKFSGEPALSMLNLDAPLENTITAGLLKVRGWVFSSTATITSVYALLNGKFITDLAYGLYRSDVRELRKQPGALHSGFEGILQFEATETGSQLLTVRAVDTKGEVIETSVEVNVIDDQMPIAEIEQVSWQDNKLEVRGWAVWPHSHTPRSVRIFVKDKFVGQTRLNLIRSDIAERFPQLAVSYGCGFQFSDYLVPDEIDDKTPVEVAVQFVDGHGRQIRRTTHVGYEYRHGTTSSAALLQELAQILDEYQLEFKQAPALLDWHTGLKLSEAFPEQTIFTPVTNANTLPYADKSVEIVVLTSRNPSYLAEARRVASFALVRLETTQSTNGKQADKVQIHLERLGQAGENRLPPTAIIIPVYNKSHYTQACLARLVTTLPRTFRGEIIVVDDASSDDTQEVLAKWAAEDARIKIARNAQNSGFIFSCNAGAAAATSEVLVFLNNDTLPEPNWLPPLLEVLTTNPQAGAVGGKLVYPDGTLQEAGGIIFNDGSGANFGRGDKQPDAALYNYLREVDYCSGALLATRRALFAEMGGFDSRYAPAYYEDTDYCFGLRAKGYKVFYQPASSIIHFEGISSGTDLTQGVKSYQVVNRTKFVEKWREALQRQPAPPTRYDFATLQKLAVRDEFAKDETKRIKRALVCAPRMPEFDREGGSRRIFHALEFLQEAGWAISFVAQKSINGERYARMLQQMGIATYVEKFAEGVSDDYLIEPEKLVAGGQFDLALLAFWPVAENWLPIIRTISPDTRIVIDSIDFHALRITRSVFREPSADRLHGKLENEDGELIIRELNTYAAADTVLTVSQKEADLINDFTASPNLTHAMPDREDIEASALTFAERKGMVFIGNFNHPPNADAIKFLCKEILPLLDQALLAEQPVYIVGNGLDEKVQSYAEGLANVHMVGWVPSVVPYLQQARISLVPLLNGAGTKRKLIQAMMVGTPSVSTTIGVEGLNLQRGKEVLIADEPADFAEAIRQLLTDQALWQRLANVGRAKINLAHSSALVRARFEAVITATMRKKAKTPAQEQAKRLAAPQM